MKHYTEVDLLEVHYLPAEALMPVHKHLSSCPECMSRYDSLQKKLRTAARLPCSLVDQKPATFWDRQRFSIMRKIQARPAQAPAINTPPRSWIAAAAAMVVVASIVLVLTTRPDAGMAPSNESIALVQTIAPETEIDAAADVFQELRAVNDPWNSDELSPFRGAVEWETWTAESPATPRGAL